VWVDCCGSPRDIVPARSLGHRRHNPTRHPWVRCHSASTLTSFFVDSSVRGVGRPHDFERRPVHHALAVGQRRRVQARLLDAQVSSSIFIFFCRHA
jgi:hypothetical protein